MSLRRRPNGNTESVDNYLKAIFSLGGPEEHKVTIKMLSEHLQVAPASVTNMLQKLAAAEYPFVEYERHGGVQLSKAGRRRALEIVRHHRLIETFLYEVLDYPLEELHDEAERLEHFISERFEERIAAKLGHPKMDPHGHSIPTLEGDMRVPDSILLSEVEQEGWFRIESVSDRKAQNLRMMESRGMTPGAKLRIRRTPSAAGFYISVGRSPEVFRLSREVARDVRIVPFARP